MPCTDTATTTLSRVVLLRVLPYMLKVHKIDQNERVCITQKCVPVNATYVQSVCELLLLRKLVQSRITNKKVTGFVTHLGNFMKT
jgi:hypothetical protein